MRLTHGRALAISAVAAVVTFAVVQDRVTAAGARQYVALQRAATAEGRSAPTIEDVMAPARARAVSWAGGAAGIVFAIGASLSGRLRGR